MEGMSLLLFGSSRGRREDLRGNLFGKGLILVRPTPPVFVGTHHLTPTPPPKPRPRVSGLGRSELHKVSRSDHGVSRFDGRPSSFTDLYSGFVQCTLPTVL